MLRVQQLNEKGSDMIVEVAANQEESFVSAAGKAIEETKINNVQANLTFNPYVEDVFSAGLTVL